ERRGRHRQDANHSDRVRATAERTAHAAGRPMLAVSPAQSHARRRRAAPERPRVRARRHSGDAGPAPGAYPRRDRAAPRRGRPLARLAPGAADLGRLTVLAWAPERQRQRTIEIVLDGLRALATRQPLLVLVEDLHWMDASSLELLALLVDQVATVAICVLLTARPDFRPPWAARSHTTQITLTRLPRRQTEQMILSVAGNKPFPAEVLQHVLNGADGVPLFVEEITKMVLESGLLRDRDDHYELTAPLRPLAIPATLRDSLTARLDRLPEAKSVAQLAAAIGREFSYELLQAVSPLDPAVLQRELARLVAAGFSTS